jgi:two-component system cell cycle response regulator DivK
MPMWNPSPTVFLVSAARDDREMYATYLRQHACVVVECGSTDDALQRCATADIIITGIEVPGSFDGLELVRRVRADGAYTKKPIIVLTAAATVTNRNTARLLGCDAFLPKPCVPDLLLQSIRRLLPSQRPIAAK